MQDFNLSVKYKPALIFKDANLLQKIYSKIVNIFRDKKYISGKELIESLSSYVTKPQIEALIFNFVDRKLLKKDSTGFNFSKFIFCNLNDELINNDLIIQKETSQLLKLVTKDNTAQKSKFKIVATFPKKDPNFKFKGNTESIYTHIQRLFSESQDSIFIINPFFDEEGANKVIPTLIAAAEADVNIRLIVREAYVKDNMQKAIKMIKDEFKNKKVLNKIQIRDYYKKNSKGQIYATHAKIIMIDNKECYTGSANITVPSMYYNFELGCIIEGEQIKNIKKMLDELWECSVPV